MNDEQQLPATEISGSGVVSFDPAAAAVKAVDSQPWSKEAGLNTPAPEAPLAAPEPKSPDASVTDSGMGTWTGDDKSDDASPEDSPAGVEVTTEIPAEPAATEVAGHEDFGTTVITRSPNESDSPANTSATEWELPATTPEATDTQTATSPTPEPGTPSTSPPAGEWSTTTITPSSASIPEAPSLPGVTE